MKLEFNQREDRLVSLGDLMDRGKAAYEVFSFFRQLKLEMKERCMVEGITELSACKVGLVGFGDIARATAERLAPLAEADLAFLRAGGVQDIPAAPPPASWRRTPCGPCPWPGPGPA